MRFSTALVTAAAVLVGGCSTTGSQLQQSAVASTGRVDPVLIDRTLKSFIDSGELVGVSALIYQHGKQAYFGAFGMADREAKRPMTRDTIVRIYSMTKPVTGVALMTLWEQGKFRLDDPVAKYIPELANVRVYAGTDASGNIVTVPVRRPMTIRDLTRHTSGLTYCSNDNLPELKPLCDKVDPRNINNTLDQFAQKLGMLPLEYQPGTQWKYSFAADVQALLVQRLAGEPYEQYIQDKVLKPLGMTHTRIYLPENERNKLATVYEWHPDDTFTPAPEQDSFRLNTSHRPLTPGGYGLTSTLDDYSRFTRMLLNGGELDGVRVLQPQTVQMMSTSQLDPAITNREWLDADKGQMGFGIDFAVRVAPPKTSDEKAGEVGEFFWDGFANTLFWVDPKNDLTAVLFTQYQPFGKVPLHKAFRDAVYATVDPDALAPQ
ncbi:MAG: beta-lactamase family protein [Alphaproteobacteria bacterium]|nr:beta-lactamase family protein [Alphaproteobacteria bacterium]MDE2110170.1 beta-lactamase family protein [Alphaproteobacteria bacterium]MDE2492504.1 beta-lactamase family protein [Alphaproteobacteria bacterium]